MTTSVAYVKLRSGEWGVRAPFPLASGQIVTVKGTDGKERTERLGTVLSSHAGWFVAVVVPNRPRLTCYTCHGTASANAWGGVYCDRCGKTPENLCTCPVPASR